jgi:hypothetical protein
MNLTKEQQEQVKYLESKGWRRATPYKGEKVPRFLDPYENFREDGGGTGLEYALKDQRNRDRVTEGKPVYQTMRQTAGYGFILIEFQKRPSSLSDVRGQISETLVPDEEERKQYRARIVFTFYLQKTVKAVQLELENGKKRIWINPETGEVKTSDRTQFFPLPWKLYSRYADNYDYHQLLILEEKHYTYRFAVPNLDALLDACMQVFLRRDKEGFWFRHLNPKERELVKQPDLTPEQIAKLSDGEVKDAALRQIEYHEQALEQEKKYDVQWKLLQAARKGDRVAAYRLLSNRGDGEYEGFKLETLDQIKDGTEDGTEDSD